MSISILVPIYNVEKYIGRCARSLFEQTYPDIEYIFVNDCTPDNSIEILKNVIQDYPQRKEYIRIITHEKNRGLAAARNTAVENCQTDFLMHVDSDDYIEKDAVEKLINKQKEGDYDIVTGNAVFQKKDSQEILHKNEPIDKEALIKLYIQTVYNHTIWGRLIRTSLYKDNTIQALEGCNIGEDHQVIPQLFYYANRFSSIDDIIYHYDCTNENSYMSQHNFEKAELREICNTRSFNVLRLFFKDKSPVFQEQIYKSMPIVLRRAQYYSTVNNHKKNYKRMADLFNELDKNILRQTGFRYSPLKLLLINNFYIARIRYILSIYYKKFSN
jgi:glycosyltransferase involved in cell wall biosynthesis